VKTQKTGSFLSYYATDKDLTKTRFCSILHRNSG